MKKEKFILIIILISVCLSTLFAQRTEVVLDTVYSKCLVWNDHYLFIGDQQESILVKDDTIQAFPVQVDRFRAGTLGVPLVQVDSRCYLLNDELDFDPDKYIELDLRGLSYDLYVLGNTIAYAKGNDVFVADFATHETDFILGNATVSSINEQYLYLRRSSSEERFIYKLETQELAKLPPAFKYPKTEHPYFIVNVSLDDKVHVLDLDLNDLILPAEGYTDYYTKGDLLIVYGRQKPIKIFYKNKPLPLEEQFIDAQCNYYSKLCFLTNLADKIAVLSPEGEFLTPSIFDNAIGNSFQAKDILSIVKGDSLQVYTPDFKFILAGDYDEVSYVYNDRLLVNHNGRYSVIDSTKSEVITSLPIIPTYMNAFTEYGPKLLFAYNGTESVVYDYEGSEIVRWVNQEGDQFASPGKYNRAMNLRMIAELSTEQEERINPTGTWIWREKRAGTNVEFLCDKSGKRLSSDFKSLMRLPNPDLYFVRTMSRKLGVLRVEKEE